MKHKLYLNIQNFVTDLLFNATLHGKYQLIDRQIELNFHRRFTTLDEYLTWTTRHIFAHLQGFNRLIAHQPQLQQLYSIMDKAQNDPEILFEIEQLIRSILPLSLYIENKDSIYVSYLELIECFLEDSILFQSMGGEDTTSPQPSVPEVSEVSEVPKPTEQALEPSTSNEEESSHKRVADELMRRLAPAKQAPEESKAEGDAEASGDGEASGDAEASEESESDGATEADGSGESESDGEPEASGNGDGESSTASPPASAPPSAPKIPKVSDGKDSNDIASDIPSDIPSDIALIPGTFKRSWEIAKNINGKFYYDIDPFRGNTRYPSLPFEKRVELFEELQKLPSTNPEYLDDCYKNREAIPIESNFRRVRVEPSWIEAFTSENWRTKGYEILLKMRDQGIIIYHRVLNTSLKLDDFKCFYFSQLLVKNVYFRIDGWSVQHISTALYVFTVALLLSQRLLKSDNLRSNAIIQNSSQTLATYFKLLLSSKN